MSVSTISLPGGSLSISFISSQSRSSIFSISSLKSSTATAINVIPDTVLGGTRTTSVSSISSSQSPPILTSTLPNGSASIIYDSRLQSSLTSSPPTTSVIDNSHFQSSSTTSAISSPYIASTLIISTPTPILGGSLSEGAKAGIAVGVIISALFVIGSVFLIWRRRNHRKNGRVNLEEPGPIFTSPEVVEKPHELDGEEILELDSSMLYQPAEIDGTAAATASNQGSVQNSVIVPKSDQETPTLPEAILEKRGTETRNSSQRQRSPGREAKTQAEMDEIDRLEEEKRRIDEMIADAERLEILRKQRSAIQDRIRQAKKGSTGR